MFTLWHILFSLALMFPGLRIEAPNRVSVYTLSLKRRTMKLNFRSYILNLVKINISFFLSKVGSPGADLSANHATLVKWSGLIYWPNLPIRQKFVGRFIYPNSVKGLK